MILIKLKRDSLIQIERLGLIEVSMTQLGK